MSQRELILDHLRKHPRAGLTTWQAIQKFRITRLSGRILELRREHEIVSEMRKLPNGKRVAVYRLVN